MTPQASVIIASRGRGPMLARCLLSLEFQTCPSFEVIVVGDRAARQAVTAGPGLSRVGFVPFEAPNIAVARNAGVAQACAPVVAFLDDDAVAEPCWLEGLVVALRAPGGGVAAGYVRGPDGVAFQWAGEWLSPSGLSVPMRPAPEATGLVAAQEEAVPGIMGTNFAVSRAALDRAGGFDARFRYFLDESDLVLRLTAKGYGVAYAPRAQVHHSLAAGPHRRADRVPRSLQEIGRSAAVFAQVHTPEAVTQTVAAHRTQQRLRLIKAMVSGRCLPDQVWTLLRSFDRGVAWANRPADLTPSAEFLPAERPFAGPAQSLGATRTRPAPRPAPFWVRASGREDRSCFAQAEKTAQDGGVATVLVPAGRLSHPTVSFEPPGIWVHRLPLGRRQMTADRHIHDRIYEDYTGIRIWNDDGT